MLIEHLPLEAAIHQGERITWSRSEFLLATIADVTIRANSDPKKPVKSLVALGVPPPKNESTVERIDEVNQWRAQWMPTDGGDG